MEERQDLISRQAAIDALDQIFDRCEEIEAHLPECDPGRTGYKMYPDYVTVWKYLHQVPSAQPEIIHCRDCIHIDHVSVRSGSLYCTKIRRYMKENDFCSLAERITDEGD